MEITVTNKVTKPAVLGLSKPKNSENISVACVTVKLSKKTKVELIFSKYDTENDWYLDCQFTNGLPDFNHGEGSRCCIKKVAQGSLLEAIDSAPVCV